MIVRLVEIWYSLIYPIILQSASPSFQAREDDPFGLLSCRKWDERAILLLDHQVWPFGVARDAWACANCFPWNIASCSLSWWGPCSSSIPPVSRQRKTTWRETLSPRICLNILLWLFIPDKANWDCHPYLTFQRFLLWNSGWSPWGFLSNQGGQRRRHRHQMQ